MKPLRFALFVLLISTPEYTFSQIQISGSTSDAQLKSRVPFVNIYLKDRNLQGTASNVDGKFVLTVATLPVTLYISHVAYEKKEVTITSASDSVPIALTPLTITLSEVTISATNPVAIVNSMFEKLVSSSAAAVGHGFYRQMTKCDDTYTKIIELFYKSHVTYSGIDITKVENGRAAARPDIPNGYLTNQNFSTFTNTFPLVQTKERSFFSPIRKDADSLYEFSLAKTLHHKAFSKIVYVINFKPRQGISKPAFEGQLYIDDQNNLIRFVGVIADPRFNPLGGSVNPENVSQLTLSLDAFCDNGVNDVFLLENFKVDLSYVYRYDQTHTRKVHTGSFYFVYAIDKSSEMTANEKSSENDYQAIHNTSRDDSFWDKNAVLAQTPLEKDIIKQFRKSKAFREVFKVK